MTDSNEKTLALILAASENDVIGYNGGIPWKLNQDMRRFRDITLGHTVVMGRKTYESLPRKPLPGRHNVVVTRNADFEAPDCIMASSLDDAIELVANHDPHDSVALGTLKAELLLRTCRPITPEAP